MKISQNVKIALFLPFLITLIVLVDGTTGSSSQFRHIVLGVFIVSAPCIFFVTYASMWNKQEPGLKYGRAFATAPFVIALFYFPYSSIIIFLTTDPDMPHFLIVSTAFFGAIFIAAASAIFFWSLWLVWYFNFKQADNKN